jgi:hypothetical protein
LKVEEEEKGNGRQGATLSVELYYAARLYYRSQSPGAQPNFFEQ